MVHIIWEKEEYWFVARGQCQIYLYKSKDGEIFTSKQSLFRYLFEKKEKIIT